MFGKFSGEFEIHPFILIEESGKITVEKWWDLKREIQNHEKIKNPIDWFRSTFDDSPGCMRLALRQCHVGRHAP